MLVKGWNIKESEFLIVMDSLRSQKSLDHRFALFIVFKTETKCRILKP